MNNEIIHTRLVYYHYLIGYVPFFLAFFVQKNCNDLPDQEDIELMPMPLTSKGKSNAVAILISTENIDDDDNDEDEDDDVDDDDENSHDLLDQESTELMPMPLAPQGNNNTAAILMSTENIDDDDNERDDFLDQESMELLPMTSTSQGNSNASAIVITIENIDEDNDDYDDDDDDEKENSSGFLDQEEIELLPMPSTLQGNSNASAILKSTQNNDDDEDDDEEQADNFTTKNLFSFAWQISKGMVGINVKILSCSDSRPPQEMFSKQIISTSRSVLRASFTGNFKHL